MQIALKECHETEYWLELLMQAEVIDEKIAEKLLKECMDIKHILISTCKTVKKEFNE